MKEASLEILPLGPERVADFLAFFDGPAFADNPAWRFCYCQYLHVDHRVVLWKNRTEAENRAAACARIPRGEMRGWLAYREREVVGFCNAAPRPLYEALADAPDPRDATIGAIGCFVVAAPHRRTGVARALLDAACEGFQRAGLTIAEAMPVEGASGDGENHHGPLAMFLAAGFAVHRRDERRVIVRKALV